MRTRTALILTAGVIVAMIGMGTSVASASLLVNGDFESGSLTSGDPTASADADAGWYEAGGWSIVSGGTIDGSKEAEKLDSGDTEAALGQIVTDNAASTGGYTFSFDYHLVWKDRVANDGQDTIGFLYYVFGTDNAAAALDLSADNPNDGNWTELLNDQVSETFADDGSSQSASGSVSTPVNLTGHDYLAVAIRWEKSAFGTDWSGIKTGTGAHVDNVALYVPEPATLGVLLGLGGLGLLRRRR